MSGDGEEEQGEAVGPAGDSKANRFIFRNERGEVCGEATD